LWKFQDRLHISLERKNTPGSNLMTQKFHRTLPENAFLPVYDEAELLESLEKLAKVYQVLLHRVTGEDDVIQVHK
jgi:hypothetical protein